MKKRKAEIRDPFDLDDDPPSAQDGAENEMAELAAADLTHFFGTNGPLAQYLDGYESRPSQLAMAEAVQRGWITGSAAEFYAAGVTAHMQQLGDADANSAVPAAAITAYLQKNPYVAANGLEMINTQYWVASLLNGPEVFANFRRSGFPKLTPNPYPGKEIKGNFINRITYPDSEGSVNVANLAEVVSRQGPDNQDTRVWWDKQ